MKRDLYLELTDYGFDLAIENGDFKNQDGMDTALNVSLFTDARATREQVVVPENRRGWLGNIVSEVAERQLGGYLWLTEQRRLTQDTLNEVVDYCRKSLVWLLEDNVCLGLEVTGAIVPRTGIALNVDITARNGATDSHYFPLWEVTGYGD